MTDKNYVISKIIDRMSGYSAFKENLDKNTKDLKLALDKLDNVDIMAVPGDTFDDSIIGWISFCKLVEEVLSNNEDITVDNIKSKFIKKPVKVKDMSALRLEEVVDPALLEPKIIDIDYLLSISEETDIADSMDPSKLTLEGLKSRGLIDQNITYLSAEEVNENINFVEKNIVMIKDKHDTIFSPFTNSTNVFKIDETTYMDLDTGEEFKVFVEEN